MGLLFSSIEFDATGSLEGLMGAVEQATAMGAQSLLILSCDGNDLPSERLNDYLAGRNIPLCGGIFPQIIHQQNAYERGNLVCGLTTTAPIATLEGLSNLTAQNIAEATIGRSDINAAQSYLVLTDGASPHLDTLIQHLSTALDPEKIVLGGGAGSLEMVEKPCLMTAQGLISDAALLIGLSHPINIGIGHGWEPVAGPFVVTQSQGHRVMTLDYRPAFEVYRDALEPLTQQRLDQADFFSVANRFPLAIEGFTQQPVIRDPLQLSGSTLICSGPVPEHTAVHIARGHWETIIAAASEGAQTARGAPESAAQQRDTVVFDCINRQLYLEEKFAAELAGLWATASTSADLVGALSFGQIARANEGALQLFNKTAVTGVSQDH